MSQRIVVIVNPAAGGDRPVLALLNRAFRDARVDWDVQVTDGPDDARRFAAAAVRDGVDAVGVYGGDGTVVEVASALVHQETPLAILPGGTANVIARELGIPGDLSAACALARGKERAVRAIDVGEVNERHFLIRVGMGFEADMIQGADRALKDRVGLLAYALSAARALRDPRLSRYRLTIDGRTIDTEGITCILANSGSFGPSGLQLAPSIDVGDGVLDAVVVASADLGALASVAASIVAGNEAADALQHWQGREVELEADPPQTVQADGDLIGQTPVRARILPRALRVIVPRPAQDTTAD